MELLKKERIDIAIIGGGPAGMAAAIQLNRFDLQTTLFEKNRLGGLLWNAQNVENYPGFYDGIPGPHLITCFQKHLEKSQTTLINEEILTVDFIQNDFLLHTREKTFLAHRLICATGTKPKKGEYETLFPIHLRGFLGFEVYPFSQEKGKTFVVIGSGDIAFDYALQLSIENEVNILHRHSKPNALPLLVRRTQTHTNITRMSHTTVMGVKAGKAKTLRITYQEKETIHDDLECDFLLVAIGREPQKPIFTDALQQHQEMLKSERRLFFIGDVVNGLHRQVAIATGNGIETAMKIYEVIQ